VGNIGKTTERSRRNSTTDLKTGPNELMSTILPVEAETGAEPSVGSVGDGHDNALAEPINGFYKTEITHRPDSWRSFEAVEFATLTGSIGSMVADCYG
jgi:hypothetical protein